MNPTHTKYSTALSQLIYVTLLTTASSFASDEQFASLTTEDDFLTGIPVVLTATRLSQNALQAPSSITVIDGAMIKASGAEEVSDLFRLVPGFQVAYFSNNTAVVAANGMTGDWQRRLQVLVDGRSIYIPLLSTVDWATIGVDVGDIERIEVVRGPNTPAFGSNAFLGVINIITKQAYGAPALAVDATIGTNRAPLLKDLVSDTSVSNFKSTLDARKLTLRHGSNIGGVDYRLTAGYRQDSGFRDTNDGKKLTDASFRASFNPSLNDIIDLQAGISMGTIGAFNNPNDPFYDHVRDKNMLSHFQSIKWTRAQSSNNEWKLHLYHNYFKEGDTVNLGTASSILSHETGGEIPPSVIQDLYGRPDEDVLIGTYDGVGQRFDGELQYTGQINIGAEMSPWRFVGGVGARVDVLQSLFLTARSDSLQENSMRAFANFEIPLVTSTTMNVGAMVESNQGIGTFVSPRGALNFNFARNHMLRASATEAYRMPSLLEQNFKEGLQFSSDRSLVSITHISRAQVSADYPAQNLRPERIREVEFGYIFDSHENNLTVDARVFYEDIRDGILQVTDDSYTGQSYAHDTSTPFIWDNVINSKVQGFETQVRYRPIPRTLLSLQYGFAECRVCSYERFRNPKPDRTDTLIRDISSSIPRNTVSALGAYRAPYGIDMSVNYYFVDKISWLEDGEDMPAYHRVDLRIGTQTKLDRYTGDIALVLQSINGAYQEFRKHYWFDPRAFLQFSLSL